MSGWQLVEKKNKRKQQEIVLVDVPRNEWCEWDEESRNIFLLLREKKAGLTAVQLGKSLNMSKDEVGEFLYSDDMQPYVERRGNAPNRVWRIKRKEQ